MATPGDVLKTVKDEGVEIVDVRFCDLPGLMQHFSIPAHELTEDVFEDGLGFDGSSIRGFQEIQESDMLLIPDPDTAIIDPFREHKTLNINCFVKDPVTGESYSRDPRYIAKKAEDYLKGTGIADTAYFGPEAEFYIFDSVRFDQNQYSGYYFLDSVEGVWNSGREFELDGSPNLGVQAPLQGGLLPRPADGLVPGPALRDGARAREGRHLDRGAAPRGRHRRPGRDRHALRHAGDDGRQAHALQVRGQERGARERQVGHVHAEAALPGQRLGHARAPVVVEGRRAAVLRREGLRRPLRPRALVHRRPAQARAVDLAFTNPTTNSYKRLVPGYEAPVNLVYSQRNRSASVRIPLYSKSPKAKRIEFRCPDPSCNPYLAFAALLMAGLDGIENRIEPPTPVDRDLYDLPPEELAKVPQVPGSLDEALDALEADHEFLLAGGVFTPDVIETWIAYKRENEIDAVRLRPHPWEFYMYYDI